MMETNMHWQEGEAEGTKEGEVFEEKEECWALERQFGWM